MRPLTEPEIRSAFVNCTKGEAKRLNVPRDLAGYPWDDLDFLGWRDPQAPERAYFAAELNGGLVAVALRCPGPSPLQKRSNIIRDKKPVMGLGGRFRERLPLAERADRTMTNLAAFLDKVTA